MVDRSELLVQYGFIKSTAQDKYYLCPKHKVYKPKAGYKLSGKDADEEYAEIQIREFIPTGFPTPKNYYRLMWEVPDLSLEEPYYWMLDSFKENMPIIDKLEDSFAAAEISASFGLAQQRLGIQQDKISQFLVATGKMIKELFQMIRELRILDERLTYYEGTDDECKKPIDKRAKGDCITLKGIFVDLVQGGGKSAASVYGMARELEFITLPDLFFDAPPMAKKEELEQYVNELGKDFNQNVIRVLHRHLHQFHHWRFRTHQEHKQRKKFMLSYLKQHYQIIRTYIQWLKPYLRNVQKLTLNDKNMNTADIVSAFESSMIDIEFLARKGKGKAYGCVLATFQYRTRAELKVSQDGYNRGPVHIGRMEVYLRVYTWSEEQVQNYKRLKEAENLAYMGNISTAVQEAMDSLGDELTTYLGEAQGEKAAAEEEPQRSGFLQNWFPDFYTPKPPKPKNDRKEQEQLLVDLAAVEGAAKAAAWGAFHYFKKSHRMIAW